MLFSELTMKNTKNLQKNFFLRAHVTRTYRVKMNSIKGTKQLGGVIRVLCREQIYAIIVVHDEHFGLSLRQRLHCFSRRGICFGQQNTHLALWLPLLRLIIIVVPPMGHGDTYRRFGRYIYTFWLAHIGVWDCTSIRMERTKYGDKHRNKQFAHVSRGLREE